MKDAQADAKDDILTIQAVTTSNRLYGNDTLSAFEMAKGSAKSVNVNAVSKAPDYIVNAQERFSAKRKLVLILKSSNAIFERHVKARDTSEIY